MWDPSTPRSARKSIAVHRYMWTQKYGPIPDGLMVCHKCDNPACMNTDHLFLGTARDNAQDMAKKGRHWQQQKTHCIESHEYSPDNTYIDKHGHRHCKQCNRERMRDANKKRMAN